MTECAVWYHEYYSPRYELFDDEEGAAMFAVMMEHGGYAAVDGIQRSDGGFIPLGKWTAYKVESARRDAESEEERKRWSTAPKPKTRKVKLPSDPSRTYEVLASDPEWLGIPL